VRVGRAATWLAAVLALWPLPLPAEPLSLYVDASRSRVEIELGATLHTVRGGAVVLPGGRIDFDPETGTASGRVVVDATSVDTGNARRDRGLHAEVLESDRHPEIVFHAKAIEVTARSRDAAHFVLRGELEIHGGRHAVSLEGDASGSAPGALEANARVTLPYVAWGMRDMSNFLLSVDPEVQVRASVSGTLTPVSPREPAGDGSGAPR